MQTGWTIEHIMSLEKALLHELFVFCEYIEPIGSLVESNRAGQVAATLATVNSKKAYKPSDFFPELENRSIKEREENKKRQVLNGFNWLFHGDNGGSNGEE